MDASRRNFLRAGCVMLALASPLVLAKKTLVKSTILQSRCVGCGDCVRACPVQAIALQRGKAWIDREKCVGCKVCSKTCSYGAPR
jgi:Fe-S-cluster-containing hydrogenase component 2